MFLFSSCLHWSSILSLRNHAHAIYRFFFSCKNILIIFRKEKLDIFNIFAQNIVHTICVSVTAKLICAFVFASADCWFFHVAAQMFDLYKHVMYKL